MASSLEAALQTLGEAGLAEPVDHPTREKLVAFCEGELSAQESEAIEAHLAWCREDSDFVLAFREISAPDTSEEESAEDLNAAWSDFVSRQSPAPAVPRSSSVLPAPQTPRSRGRFRMPRALAASFFVAALMAAGWLVVRSNRLPVALANGQIVDLGATDEERAAGPGAKEIVLEEDQGSLTLILHPTRELDAGNYSVALLTRGEVVWQGAVRPTELDTFHVTFPRESLPAGAYLLELRRAREGPAEVTDRFPLRIEHRSKGSGISP